jgi:hypothetical protein
MKKIGLVVPLLCLLACGGGNRPPPQAHIALPPGSQLKPYDPNSPGQAGPLYTAQLSGLVYAALSNLRFQGTSVLIAGPGFLASIDAFAGTVGLIDLGGPDEHQCTDPGVVRADSGKLYVACSGDFGDFNASASGRALVEVDPATKAVTRTWITPNGSRPSGVAAATQRIWTGDSQQPQLISIDRTTFVTVDGADPAHPAIPVPCPSSGQFPYVPYVGIVSGDLYALCATSEAGILSRFDATTGASKGSVAVGASPTEFAATGDGRIAVVNSLDNTLTLVTPGTPLTAQLGFTFPQSSTLQDVKAHGQFVFTVSSGTNSVQKIDLAAPGGPKLVAAASTGQNSNPFNLEALDDDTVVVVNLATNDVVAPPLLPAQ